MKFKNIITHVKNSLERYNRHLSKQKKKSAYLRDRSIDINQFKY